MGYDREQERERVIPRFTHPCPWMKGGSFVRWVIELPTEIRDKRLARKCVIVEWC